MEDPPACLWVGCNIGCTDYKNMYPVRKLAEIGLLAGSVMGTAVLDNIHSCLLAFARMKTGNPIFNHIGKVLKYGCD